MSLAIGQHPRALQFLQTKISLNRFFYGRRLLINVKVIDIFLSIKFVKLTSCTLPLEPSPAGLVTICTFDIGAGLMSKSLILSTRLNHKIF